MGDNVTQGRQASRESKRLVWYLVLLQWHTHEDMKPIRRKLILNRTIFFYILFRCASPACPLQQAFYDGIACVAASMWL